MAKSKKIARYKEGLWLTKDNKLIRMHGNMTSLSYKLTNYFLWLSIREGRLDNLQITTSDIKNILEYKKTGLTQLLDEESNKIMQTLIEIKNKDNGEWEKMTLIPYMKYEKGVVTAKINPDLIPYITGLTSNFTKTNYTMLNSCSYPAMRLAEICNSWANAGYAYYSIDEWRHLLGATSPSYQAMPQFRRRVLNPAVKEVSERTDYEITPIEVKAGRKVTHIKMLIKRKADEGQDTVGGELDKNALTFEEANGSCSGENRPEQRKNPPFSQNTGTAQTSISLQSRLSDKPLSSIESDVVERMVLRYGYNRSKAEEAVRRYGAVYCQEQMEIVRKAIKSAEISGKEIRSKSGYLHDALKDGYAQIKESLARAKKEEKAEEDDKKLWDRQAKAFFYGNRNEQTYPTTDDTANKKTEAEIKYQKELEKWKKMRASIRREFFAMIKEGKANFIEIKEAMDDFDAAYPKPTLSDK